MLKHSEGYLNTGLPFFVFILGCGIVIPLQLCSPCMEIHLSQFVENGRIHNVLLNKPAITIQASQKRLHVFR